MSLGRFPKRKTNPSPAYLVVLSGEVNKAFLDKDYDGVQNKVEEFLETYPHYRGHPSIEKLEEMRQTSVRFLVADIIHSEIMDCYNPLSQKGVPINPSYAGFVEDKLVELRTLDEVITDGDNPHLPWIEMITKDLQRTMEAIKSAEYECEVLGFSK